MWWTRTQKILSIRVRSILQIIVLSFCSATTFAEPVITIKNTVNDSNFQTLEKELLNYIQARDCEQIMRLGEKIYRLQSDHLTSLQAIAECVLSRKGGVGSSSHNNLAEKTAQEAKVIFEKSKILSIVPKLLEMAQIKDLIPILKEVEVKKDKSLSDYLMINEIYERLGEPEKQISNLEEAIRTEKGNPQLLILLASKQISAGHRDQAENILKQTLETLFQEQARFYLIAYVMALAYPFALSVALVFLIWFLGALLAYRKIIAFKDWSEARYVLPILTFLLPALLGFTFWQTGKALPIGVLILILLIQIFMLLNPILKIVYSPVIQFIKKIFYFVFAGTPLARALNSLSTPTRVLISMTTLIVLGAVAPSVEDLDLKYFLILMGSLVLYATIGSLMVTFMRSRSSLYISLRWLGIVATFPFLISYFVANWSQLGTPLLLGQAPTEAALNGLASYLVFWGVSLFLALHISKILSEALVQPIAEMIEKVSAIEKGQFEAKASVMSRDEVGLLAQAINRMGSGLEKREKIEKTFRKYVDSKVAERILEGVESELRIEGQSVPAVVMFADIRGFTSMSEKTTPQEIVLILNQFFERMVKIVQAHHGVIDKFIGDNMMVVWGVPKPIPEAEKLAAQAALAMMKEILDFNREKKALGLPELGVGIGINTGAVVAGSIGSQDRMEYTVIGDTVNTAQRCESNAQRQQIVVTEEFYLKLKDQYRFEALEPLKVKGKEGLQHWWSLQGVL